MTTPVPMKLITNDGDEVDFVIKNDVWKISPNIENMVDAGMFNGNEAFNVNHVFNVQVANCIKNYFNSKASDLRKFEAYKQKQIERDNEIKWVYDFERAYDNHVLYTTLGKLQEENPKYTEEEYIYYYLLEQAKKDLLYPFKKARPDLRTDDEYLHLYIEQVYDKVKSGEYKTRNDVILADLRLEKVFPKIQNVVLGMMSTDDKVYNAYLEDLAIVMEDYKNYHDGETKKVIELQPKWKERVYDPHRGEYMIETRSATKPYQDRPSYRKQWSHKRDDIDDDDYRLIKHFIAECGLDLDDDKTPFMLDKLMATAVIVDLPLFMHSISQVAANKLAEKFAALNREDDEKFEADKNDLMRDYLRNLGYSDQQIYDEGY